MHRENQGKLEITPNVKVTNKQQLSLAYSPGVAEPCKEIHEDPRKCMSTLLREIQLLL